MMHARLTTVRLGPGARPEETAEVMPQILPSLRALDGFKGIVVVGDGHRVVALTVWESEEALRANAGVLDQMRDAEIAGRDIEGRESDTLQVMALDLTP